MFPDKRSQTRSYFLSSSSCSFNIANNPGATLTQPGVRIGKPVNQVKKYIFYSFYIIRNN